jgi:anti-anti-sigma regulatory factor
MQRDAGTQACEVSLSGAWDASAALARLSQLEGEFDLLLKDQPRPSEMKIDLSGITLLDACGCQLLAVFLGNLARQGVAPELCLTPPEIREQIRLLGFTEAFSPAPAPQKENS